MVNHGSDLLLDKPGDFYLVRCRHCGLIYQNPQLSKDELAVHYPDDYLPYQQDIVDTALYARQVLQDRGIARYCNLVVHHHPQSGRLLDVGCSTGKFLYAMQHRKWQVQGVELSTYAAKQARENLGLNVHTGTLAEAVYESSIFDAVTLWDVLEHVPDPQIVLKEIYRILKPGGVLLFSMPNPESTEARLFGDNWVGWERPRHLYLIPPNLIGCYLQATGLEYKGMESFNGRFTLTLLSVEFALKSRGIPEKKWKPILQFISNPLTRVLTSPIYVVGEYFNKTTNMTIIAKRPFAS